MGEMTALVDQFVEAAGGKMVHTWTQTVGGPAEALVLCTNQSGTGLVVALFDRTGDGAVITLPEREAHALAVSLVGWAADRA